MIQTLLSLVETRDAETGRHSRRTSELTRVLAEALAARPSFRELTAERIELLTTLAPLHDIGKVGVPDAILLKPGPHTLDESREMRRHPEYGRDVIVKAERAAGVRDDLTLAIAKDIVFTHHERWDGTGYPQGLRGTAIPVPGRIIAVVDVYDALLAARPYQRAMTHAEAMAIIASERGTHFDPDVVDAFLSVSATIERLSAADQEGEYPLRRFS
jgi:HD-GYP domain-containing protein (c-di-GMP phosphodiesterase class II)